MRKFCGLLAILIAAALPGALSAQGGTVTGRVVDANQRPLSDVQVGIVGTTRGALTNQQGAFTISNSPTGAVEVRASRIGYQQSVQRVTVGAGQTASVNFSLSQAVVELGAIVVTATGAEQRVREIGNSVSTIQTSELEMGPIQTVSDLIAGRAPGVQILPNSGTLGSGSRIQIRGTSSVSLASTPLIIIDGIRTNNDVESTELFTGGQKTSRIDDLNPEDIESVEILKGPAASALYGTAAANGVIQITTKHGQRGTAKIGAYGQHTNLDILRSMVPDNFLAIGHTAAGAKTECDLTRRASGVCVAVDSLYQYNPLFDAANSPLRSGGVDKYGVNISGGSPTGDITYYLSGEREKGTGTVIDNSLDRINLRANVSSLVTPKLRLSANSGYITSLIGLPQNDNSGGGIFLNALEGSPTPTNVARGQGFRSPYTASNVSFWSNDEDLRRFTGSANADFRPLSWLSINGTAGVDQTNRFEKGFIGINASPSGFFSQGLREQFRRSQRDLTGTLNANAVKEFGAFTSTTAVGTQYYSSIFDWTYAAGQNVAPGTKATSEPLSADENGNGDKLFGLYGSEQIGFADRLFVTAALRGDKSNTFGQKIGFITYPAISASWVVKDEPWFPQISALSNLRLRAAYGESGLRPPRLAAAQTFTNEAAALGATTIPGFVANNVGNADLEAEITHETEFGGDLGLLDDRLGFEITHYQKKTSNALIQRPLPSSLGAPPGDQFSGGEGSQFFNLGSVSNKGWEGAFRAEPVRMENVDLNLRFNFTTNKNRLLTLGDTSIPPIVISLQRDIAGYPIAGYWAQKYTYSDANGDGLIQAAEVLAVPRLEQDDTTFNTSFRGSPFPTREYSFTGDLTLFKSFRVSGLLDHKGGNYLFNWGRRSRESEASAVFGELRQVPGAANLEEQAAIIARRKGLGSMLYIEPADFWKLRELSVRWSAPQSLVRRIPSTNGLSLTVSGRNLKTWTDYHGPDPEVNLPGQTDSSTDPGRQFVADLLTMPAPRTVVVRIDASF
jgi:TonB-linked SusC/RagA family outer membrane protein